MKKWLLLLGILVSALALPISAWAETTQDDGVTQVFAALAAAEGETHGTVTVSPSELLRCEEAHVTVDVPGATALWVYNGDDRWEGFVGSHAEAAWTFYRSGENQIFARYTTAEIDDPEQVDFDALDWTGSTEIATVYVKTLGALSVPDYTLESETVQRGQPFRITINALQGRDEWYVADLQDLNGQELTEVFFWDEYNRCVRVETIDLVPGPYFLTLHGDAVGYEGCDTRRLVTVEETAAGLTVSMPASPQLTQARPTVAAIAPGAEKLILTLDDPAGGGIPYSIEQEGEDFREEVVFGATEGVFHTVFTAVFPDGGEETWETDMQLIAPYGARPDPGLRMSGVWMEGQALRFQVDAGSALFIATDVVDEETGETVYFDGAHFDDWDYSLPAELFTPGHTYNIVVFSTEVGYNANTTVFYVVMLPDPPAQLRLPAGLTEIGTEAFAGVSAQLITIPASVRSVAPRAFADCPALAALVIEEGASGISALAFEGAGTLTVYGAPGSEAEACARAYNEASFIGLA